MDKQKAKRDLLLLVGIIFAALLVWVSFQFINHGRADVALVLQDGKVIASYSLWEDQTAIISYGEKEYNLLMISSGTAFISDADCPDKLCVSQKAISRKGESIICLPHKLVIVIDPKEEGEVDAVVY